MAVSHNPQLDFPTADPDVQRISLSAGMAAEVASLCDMGCVRQNNEDRVGVFSLPSGGALLVVADGMGGHAAGEVAAQMALDAMNEACVVDLAEPLPTALRLALATANRRILDQGEANPAQRGMGTTATALALAGEQAWFVHVGDSRLYRLRNGQLQQLSEDHSLVAEMVRGGMLSEADAVDHPCRNVIVRALGSDQELRPQISVEPLSVQMEDVFLLSSDGLHDQLSPVELANLLEAPPSIACLALVNLARERGGPDNISAVVCRVVEG
ncbi:PP2C family protein-serine/threonine phosphatase [Methylogaea oryzae]|uniref:Protein-serine/threonine phosphatase n=1 Tax=Methylogaea oryzae TaxID=1295382 RepID=A0A8D4VS70_9GAMM|nr:PP2C family serine/threonine-protein phosphatase [Methylogaea oryzae]BBL72772.1 protein-serine/threonine phosphatase [Methylogaea oryzae]